MNKLLTFIENRKELINSFCCYALFFFPLFSLIPSIAPLLLNHTIFTSLSWFGTAYRVLIFGIFIFIFLLGLVANKIALDKRLIIVLLIYVCLSIFPNLFLNSSIPVSSESIEGTLFYEATVLELVLSSFYCLRFIILMIYYTQLVPAIGKVKVLSNISKCFICFGLFTVSFIFVLQFDGLIHLYNSFSGVNQEISGMFYNKNTLGIVLAASLAFTLIQISYSHTKIPYVIFAFIFYFASIVTLARTSLVALTVMIIVYIVLNFILNKRFKFAFYSLIVVTFVVGLYFILLFNLKAFQSIPFNQRIYSAIQQTFNDSKTMTGRKTLWELVFKSLLTPVRLVFGYGDQISTNVFVYMIQNDSTYFGITSSFHNGIILSLASGGMLRTAIYIYLLYYVLFVLTDYKKDRNTISLLVSIIACFVLVQTFEEVSLFDMTFTSNVWTIILLSPSYFITFKEREKTVLTNDQITICMTTLNKTEDEIKELVVNNNLQGNVIVGCQGSDEERESKSVFGNIKLTVYFQTSLGTSKNRNYLLDKVKTKYCIFLDDDILFLDNDFELLKKEAAKYENFDLLFFNLSYKDKRKVKHFKERRFRWLDARSFGINSVLFNVNFLKQNEILFNEKIGPGCEISSGEDGQFAMEVAKKSEDCYFATDTIIEISYDNGSSWFNGYDKKYFKNVGYTYSMCYGPFADLFGIYTIIKHRKSFLVDYSFKEVFNFIKIGIRLHHNDK